MTRPSRWSRRAMLCIGMASIPLILPAQRGYAVDRHASSQVRLAQSETRLLSIGLGGGLIRRALLSVPQGVRGTVVMLPGGAGDVGLDREGDIEHGDNFVVRTRALWNRRGYAVLIPDTIHGLSLRGLRNSRGYAEAMQALVALAHRHVAGPVFLLGTSQGSIAAINGAAHASVGSIAGVVLTESVSVRGRSGETVFDAEPQRVRVPVLIVANRDDRCSVAPARAADRIAAAMTGSRDVHVIRVSGGVKRSASDCGSLTPHGYFNIETLVVDAVTRWMNVHR